MIRRFARPMLATVFVIDGVETLRNPQPRVETATPLVDKATPLVEKGEQAVNDRVTAAVPPVNKDPETLVKVLAGVKIGAGVTFALGKAPRLSALALTASHVPTTVSRNAFWNESDPALKSRKTTGLATDVALLGALLLASADTAGQPGMAWRAGKAKDRAVAKLPGAKAETAAVGGSITGAAHSVADQARDVADTVRDKAPEVADTVREKAPEVADRARSQATDLAGVVRARAPEVAARLRAGAEAAREQAAPVAAQVREQAAPVAAQVREQAAEARHLADNVGTEARKQSDGARKDLKKQAARARKDARKQAGKTGKDVKKQTARARKDARKQTDDARAKLADAIRP